MPAFSAAMASTVSPRISVWSRPMRVMTAASGTSMTLVASRRPPRPTSSTTISHFAAWKRQKAMAVTSSNWVGASGMVSAACFTRSVASARSWSPTSFPFTWKRSL